MPCHDTEYNPREEIESLRKRLDMVTDMLCSMCQQAEEGGSIISERVQTWYKAHKVQDAQRKEFEKKQREIQLAHKKSQVVELLKEIQELTNERG